jgi:hypothetical protein|nr:MAG TPA: major capsid protein [Caudoviricetes sp.]
MIVDNDLIFANNQTLTAAKESTNMIDFEQISPTGGMSGFLSVYFHVTSDVTGTLQFKLQESDDGASFTDLVTIGAELSAPKAGTMAQVPFPFEHKRYVRAYFGGAPTAGTVSAGLVWGRQLNTPAPQAASITSAPVSEASA